MVNTPLQLAEALARFIHVEDLDRAALISFAAAPDFDDDIPGEVPEVRLHLRDVDRALVLAEKYSLVDEPVLHPENGPTSVHHRFRGTWEGVRLELVYVEHLPELATDPGDDLAALAGDEGGEPE